jgi:hypothetical protein
MSLSLQCVAVQYKLIFETILEFLGSTVLILI